MVKCKKIYVPKDACTIHFSETDEPYIDHSRNNLETIRGESIILHLDKRNRVIQIELLGSEEARKPCQEEDV
jgi:hypothetical protein